MNSEHLTFGSFQLLVSQRLLLNDGVPVSVSSRAFDILVTLIRKGGTIVETSDLIAQVWPNTFVGEATLRVHLSALRKVLREGGEAGRIVNHPGRGYAFIGGAAESDATTAGLDRSASTSDAPEPLRSGARVLGREPFLETVAENLVANRLVTLVGPGGVGKTAVAHESVRRHARSFRHGAIVVDLSPVREASALAQVVASACAVATGSSDSLNDLSAALRSREMLILLDGCEHMITGVAELTEAILHHAPEVRILVTSQQALRAEGEWVLPVRPLDYPAADQLPSLESALTYPAVELFVERAAECLGYELQPADLDGVVAVCRKLEGIPLALELAAARLDTLSVDGLLQSLNDRFAILTREEASPRHQTLRATLDWSYAGLSEVEKATLRAVSVFRGCRAKAALEIASASIQRDAHEILMMLIAKSLIVADFTARAPRYRLLDTTRAYVLEKLEAAGEAQDVYRRHAQLYLALAERAEAEWEVRPTPEWIDRYAPEIGNLRIALDWAFSADGDAAMAVALTVASTPLFLQLSLVNECLKRAQAAVVLLDTLTLDTRPWRMKLLPVLGWKRLVGTGPRVEPTELRQFLALAADLGNVDYQLRSCWALWLNECHLGHPRAAFDAADAFVQLAGRSADVSETMIGERMRGRALHFMGRQAEALAAVETMLTRYRAPVNRSHLVRYQHDQSINARVIQQRIRWVMGDERRAYAQMRDVVDAAETLNHDLTLNYALAEGGCPLALQAGDFETLDRYIRNLEKGACALGVDSWVLYARAYRGELLLRRGDAMGGAQLLGEAIEKLTAIKFVINLSAFVASGAEALNQLGRAGEGRAMIDEALARCAVSGEAWCVPELLRVKGEGWLADRSDPNPSAAKACFEQSLQLSQQQGAGAWERRTSLSLADLLRRSGDGHAADALQATAMRRFPLDPGFADVSLAPIPQLSASYTS